LREGDTVATVLKEIFILKKVIWLHLAAKILTHSALKRLKGSVVAKQLKRLTANAKVAQSWVRSQHRLTHSGVSGSADEAVLNKLKTKKLTKKSHLGKKRDAQ
jgi:hypothetical protein